VCPRIGGRRDGPSSPRNTVRDLLGHGSVGMSLRYPHLAPDQRREAVAKFNEKPVLALTMRLQCEGFSAETVIGLLEWSQGLRCILICAYKRSRKCLDFPIENARRPILALTLRLRRPGKSGNRRYHSDLIGGKGGTRTLDPGIMSTAWKI
jgi:hypothetical protein